VITQKGVNSSVVMTSKVGNDFVPQPPGPIITNYTNGQVLAGQIKYYYFPIDVKQLDKETMILLNKTQIYGTGRNGDSKLMMNI
jgi:hypothetical protein